MANIDGSWDTLVKSPMGDQKATMTIQSAGDSFTGTFNGGMGSSEVKNGKIDGDTLTWAMDITVPMPMTLTGEAKVEGDTLTGGVTAGAFGTFPLSGTRVG
jgi:hypothetical protein